ncbi:MAG: hypothetical protein HYT37_00925 [Candidatus Sungbacteria bacterium]|nr:hypothetical protein [Candidatus Sungbacteria bacterium]
MLNHIAHKIQQIRGDLLEKKQHRSIFIANPKLAEVYAIFKNSPEGEWIIGKNDAAKLYGLLQTYAPQNILELGGGIGASAAIMAIAAPGGKITSIEQFEKCIDIAKKLTPPDILKNINFSYSEAHAFKNDLISPYQFFSGYKTLPIQDSPFDFVIIDGPGYWLENNQLVKLPNGDIINLLPRLAAGCKIYIDGRKQAVGIYKRFLRPYLSLIKENKQYALFERTSTRLLDIGEIKIEDAELAMRRATTPYFD